jgi:hypothetical protein
MNRSEEGHTVVKRIVKAALAATILVGLADARGADVPSYPVREWCETVSDTVGGSYVILNGCLDQEEAAARALASMPPIPERIARWCDEVATVGIGSAGSLQIYLGCVEQELEAMERAQP